MNIKTLAIGILSLSIPLTMTAQDKKMERASPAKEAQGKINGSAVTINYSSPSVKGRKIWDGLVPYGQIWRAGANEATIFQTEKPLTIEGKTLPAGKYSIYMLPTAGEWKIIFNSEVGQWGVTHTGTSDNPAKDVLIVAVKTRKSQSFTEHLEYKVTNGGFELDWEHLIVPIAAK